MPFALFLLVNAALFIRPSEVVPALQTVPVYNILIVAALAASFGPLLDALRGSELRRQPVTACVLGLAAMVWLSNMARLDFFTARGLGVEFLKVAVYFLLLMAAVTTPARLQRLLTWLAVFTTVLAAVAVLNYQHVIHVSSIELVERTDGVDPDTGEEKVVYQMTATGIYSDPNDLCTILNVALVIAAYRLFHKGGGPARVVWAAPIGLFFYALILTKSRGGLLSLLAGLLTLSVSRLGWKRALPLSLVLLPGIVLMSGGRQTRMGTGEDTAQGRIRLWVDGFHLMVRSPLTGIGAGQYAEEVGLVAHNSYVHANVELGLLGGTCFIGAFYYPLWSLYRIRPSRAEILDPELRRLRPYLSAMIAGYATGLYSISRCYVVPTYMILGLTAAYLRMVPLDRPEMVAGLDGRLVKRLAVANLAVMALIYVFIKLTVSY